MPKLNPFTLKRLQKFAADHRQNTAELPTLADFARAGFSKEDVEAAVKEKALVQWYVTLTSGATVKGYKLPSS